MNRFVRYWERYGFDFGEEVITCLYKRASLYRFHKGDTVCSPAMPSRRSYFILSGAVQVQKQMPNGQLRPVDFILPYQSFTGTVHLYKRSYSGYGYTCMKHSDILQIDNLTLMELARQYRTISDILHILKQRVIDRQQLHIELLQQPDKYQQFVFLQQYMSHWCQILSSDMLADFLHISRSTYFNYKKRWLLE